MEATIFRLLCQILQNNAPLLSIAISQRAKFEGWLKFELAAELKQRYLDTRVEESVNGLHIDIHSNKSLIELKTPNTSYSTKGCVNRICTITDNINGIISDIHKLCSIIPRPYNNGYVAFVMFPVDAKKYQYHINRVINHLGRPLHVCQGPVMINLFKTYVFVAKVF